MHLMMSGTKADFDWYAKWSKEDLHAHSAFTNAFNKELMDSRISLQPKAWRSPIS